MRSETFASDTFRAMMIAPFMFIVFGALLFGQPLLQAIGKEFAPVVTPITISEVRDVEGGVMISADATKLRPCSWLETRWYLG